MAKTAPSNHGNGARAAGNAFATHFSRVAQATASATGHPLTFLAAVLIVVAWCVTGPLFHYSDTWQLVINTGTTIVTFLMVFLIQNTQNRDMVTVQLKLSELVLAMKGAENKFADLEGLSDDELKQLNEECRARADMTRHHLERRHSNKPARKPKKAAAAHANAATRRSPRRKA